MGRWGQRFLRLRSARGNRKETVMKKILITGGTTFVSKYAAKYFVEADYEVYVLNRNSKSQVEGFN